MSDSNDLPQKVGLTTNEELAMRRAQIDLEGEQDLERLRAKALKLLDYLFDQKKMVRVAFNSGMQMGRSHNELIVRQVSEYNESQF
jgi:hypothetical protein